MEVHLIERLEKKLKKLERQRMVFKTLNILTEVCLFAVFIIFFI
jgi:hypothetical protein